METMKTINLPIDADLLVRARETWGDEAQAGMSVGEIGEYLTLFGREKQGRIEVDLETGISEWHTEIADVLITILQQAHRRGMEHVLSEVARKMARLEARLDRYDAAHKCMNEDSE